MPRPVVLIPGAWMGAWAWDDVVLPLREQGIDTSTLTLSGVAQDADVADVGLETHVADVLALLEAEDVRDVVLVGHSYSGIVAGMVADRAPERVAHVVYIAAFLATEGRALLDDFPPEERQQIAANDDRWAAPDAEGLAAEADLSADQRLWLLERLVPHPGRTVGEPAHLERPLGAQRSTYIICALEQGADGPPELAALRDEPTWDVRVLDAGHFPMVSMPDNLAAIIADVASA